MRKAVRKIKFEFWLPFVAAAVCAAVLFWVTTPATRPVAECAPGQAPTLGGLAPELFEPGFAPRPLTPWTGPAAEHAVRVRAEIRALLERDLDRGLAAMAGARLESARDRALLEALADRVAEMDRVGIESLRALELARARTERYMRQAAHVFEDDEFYHELAARLLDIDLELGLIQLQSADVKRFSIDEHRVAQLVEEYDRLKTALGSYRKLKLLRLGLQYREDMRALESEWSRAYHGALARAEANLLREYEHAESLSRAAIERRVAEYQRWAEQSPAVSDRVRDPGSAPPALGRLFDALHAAPDRMAAPPTNPRLRALERAELPGDDWWKAEIVLIGCIWCSMTEAPGDPNPAGR